MPFKVSWYSLLLCICRSVSSESLTEWLSRLEKEDIPVLVCLTHADFLCDDLLKELKTGDGADPSKERLFHRIELELKVRLSECMYAI